MNEHPQIPIEDLLAKYLAGEASPEETGQIKEWLSADPANQHYFDHLQLIWQESLRLSPAAPKGEEATREEAAWQKFQQRIHRPNSRTLILHAPWIRIAALFILLASVTTVAYQWLSHGGSATRLLSSTEQSLADTLPDGSRVTLNRHSQLSFSAGFGKKDRSVELKGEAFFQVAADGTKPFLVHTNGIAITVLGTSFNVNTRNGITEVIVETGSVQVTWKDQQVLLQRDEKVRLRPDSLLKEDSVHDRLYNYYRTREFVCDHTPLWKLAETLEEAYNVHIVIDSPALRELPLSTTFHDESLDHILSVIKETFGLSMTRKGDQIILH